MVDNGEKYEMTLQVKDDVLTASIHPYYPEEHEAIISILYQWLKNPDDRADS